MEHPCCFVNSLWDPKDAPLWFCEFAVGNGAWGSVNSRWYPNGAPLGFCEFAVVPQWCTLGVLSTREFGWNRNGAPFGYPWVSVNSRWDPNGAPLGFCEFAVVPQWCTLGVFLSTRGGTAMVHPLVTLGFL